MRVSTRDCTIYEMYEQAYLSKINLLIMFSKLYTYIKASSKPQSSLIAPSTTKYYT